MKHTYIYVKLSPLGLFYLGKTTKNPFNYLGSGIVWKRHIIKNNISKDDIKTYILHETNDFLDLKKMGEYYSNLFDVTNSEKWGNLKPENGDGGDTSMCENWKKPPIISGDTHWSKSDDWREKQRKKFLSELNPVNRDDVKEKIRIKSIGRIVSKETKNKMSENKKGNKNPFFNRKHSEVTKDIMKKKSKGRYSLEWFIKKYGDDIGKKMYDEKKIISVETLQKNKKRKHYICPHCGKDGYGPNMKRYHFNNCKIILS